MEQKELFSEDKWIGADNEEVCPVLRDSFHYETGEKAVLTILGFASFVVYINGKRVHDTYFLPLNSEFEKRQVPPGEELDCRAYPEQWDITDFLTEGENVIAVFLGNGWYYIGEEWHDDFGGKKACWNIHFEKDGKHREVSSGTKTKWFPSFVKESMFFWREEHDYTDFDFAALLPGYDASGFPDVVEKPAPKTTFYFSDCPRDRVTETVVPELVYADGNYRVYDIGVNTTGTPVIVGKGAVEVRFSECFDENKPDEKHAHRQRFSLQLGETDREAALMFTWATFRYFSVLGDASVEEVRIIHADVSVQSDFRCNNETLNWLYKAFVNTQLSNMHGGIPSDCPHMERRGYTGDGQLVCRAAMYTLDMKRFYGKWIEDIADTQDKLTGHVQYTAPYVRSGGGPGGWGCAIVQLPYQYWKFYNDDSKIRKHFDKMLHYFSYLEAHSESGLITSDQPGLWCLGDWCAPDKVLLPPPFVNNYFYVKSMKQVIEIAEYLGRQDVIPVLQKRIDERKAVMKAAYYNPHPSVRSFCGNQQGAAAFALDIGLGDAEVEERLVSHYRKLGHPDTGIFGTDVLIRYLFEKGYTDLAVTLLTAENPIGYGAWRKRGLTSLPEYWLGGRPSYSHPMFGAVTANLFEYILGIRQEKGRRGFEAVVIAPVSAESLTEASGYCITGNGKISVSYAKKEELIVFEIEIPESTAARLMWKNVSYSLKAGKNSLVLQA